MTSEILSRRRKFLTTVVGAGAAAIGADALAQAIAHIRLPERCANLCFGGPKNNRLYMTSCHSVYALYVEAHGAV